MATSTDLRSAIEEVQQQLPAGEADIEGQPLEVQATWGDRLARRSGPCPGG